MFAQLVVCMLMLLRSLSEEQMQEINHLDQRLENVEAEIITKIETNLKLGPCQIVILPDSKNWIADIQPDSISGWMRTIQNKNSRTFQGL